MIQFYTALSAAILLGVAGQIFLKSGADGKTLLAQFLAPHSLIGLGLYFTAAICYMYALRRIPVSVAFPCVSISYVIVAATAYCLYDEPLGWDKLTGIVLICAGVYFVARQ